MEKWQNWTAEDARMYITAPSIDDDKYSRGVLGVITGSKQYPGAAVLTCEGAMRTGIGMIRYLGPQIARELVLTHRPEVVFQDGQVQAWCIGSGVDPDQIGWQRKMTIHNKLDQKIPILLDAGGLSFLPRVKGPVLITPHSRELSVLLQSAGMSITYEDIKSDPKKWARLAADTLGVTVLLKGNSTHLVSKDREIELPPAPTWLATAGTGDVLAGIIGALLAAHAEKITQHPESLSAIAATGAFIHAKAAQLASNGGPITALSLAHAIPQVISDLLHSGI